MQDKATPSPEIQHFGAAGQVPWLGTSRYDIYQGVCTPLVPEHVGATTDRPISVDEEIESV